MGLYSSFCVLMDSNWSFLVCIGAFLFLWNLVCPFGSWKVFMRPYQCICFLKGPYASLCVFVGPYKSLWVLMGCYGSLCVLKAFNGSLWVLKVLFASLWILMGPYWSL